jgi:serine protease Do
MDRKISGFLVATVLASSLLGGAAGFLAGGIAANSNVWQFFGQPAGSSLTGGIVRQVSKVEENSDVISVAEKAAPAVVSVIVTKDLPKIERYYSDDFFSEFFGGGLMPRYRQNGTEQVEVGGGTGFIISEDGYIVTNKHVVADEAAEYTVLMNDEKRYVAKVLARDPMNDMAVLKIEAKGLPVLELGDSDVLKVGQSVIAIGNALGEFRNTVSTGVISGLSRSIIAGSGNSSEELAGVIQTDAAINTGNSGGPLLNIAGQVIGVNTAVAQNAQGIGFALPINELKANIESIRSSGRISRPWLGIRYSLITAETAKASKLPVDYGALIIRGETVADLAVVPGSPADKAGLRENDIILEINNQKVGLDNPLAKIIGRLKAGDEVSLKVLRQGKEQEFKAKLEEMK